MTVNEMLTLAKAGYKAGEIVELAKKQKEEAAAPTPEPEKKEDPEKKEEPEKKPDNRIDTLAAKLEALTEAIQANAILNSNIKTTEESVDDILAGIINPPKGEK